MFNNSARWILLVVLLQAGCRNQQETLDSRITPLISTPRIQASIEEFTSVPHRAGTRGNTTVGEAIQRRLREAGLQPTFSEYVLPLHEPIEASLSLPEEHNEMLTVREKRLPEDSFTSIAGEDIPYLAFVPDFDLKAHVVYANYGAREDYELLRAAGIDVKGKIALVRAQGLCRGIKGVIAQEEGVAGLLLYPELRDMGFVYPAYPAGRHINPWTIERGSMLRYFLYPGAPRNMNRDARDSTLPTIPALPVNQEIAARLLRLMDGPEAPVDWKGSMPAPYRMATKAPVATMKFRGKIVSRKIRNIFATIAGTHPGEPRVILGAHYDAWIYGAADPSSGAAVVLETANIFSELARHGWKPRRTIQFAFWDAEEFGMFGSTRWVEQNLKDLRNVAVYLSVDTAVRAKDFVGYVHPGLRGALDRALAQTPDPATGVKLFDVRGTFMLPGFSGDVAPFTSLAGVPTAEIAFGRFYPLYHSLYDDYPWFSKFNDPGFKYCATLTRILALYASSWANDQILPFRFSEIGEYARSSIETLGQQDPDTHATDSSRQLQRRLQEFLQESELLEQRLAKPVVDDVSPQINAHMQAAFRCFHDPVQDFAERNMLIGPSPETGCDSVPLPGLQGNPKKAAYLASAFECATAHLRSASAATEGK
jgi:N-acetylated-alpha-linked acidic dipeptidase